MIVLTKIKYHLSVLILIATTVTISFADEKKALFSPSTNIAWDAEQINFVKAGSASNGEKLNKDKMCSLCHGEQGLSKGRNWPNLAGQTANYTFKQLLDYKDHKRLDSTPADMMTTLAERLSTQDMADLAQYYAGFPLPQSLQENLNTALKTQNIENLIKQGDGSRMLVPCLACHGSKGQGAITDTPALAGQQAIYFRQTMNEFKSGKRHNDVYSRMRIIAKSLTQDEINAMANYFAQMNTTENSSDKTVTK